MAAACASAVISLNKKSIIYFNDKARCIQCNITAGQQGTTE